MNYTRRSLTTLAKSMATNQPTRINYSSPQYVRSEFVRDTTFDSYDCKYKNSSEFINENYTNSVPSYSQHGTLPQSPTEIKGLEAFIAGNIRQRQYRNTPNLVYTKYFLLKFFPKQHHLSLFRKSNIAYSFTNRSGFRLNDKKLDSSLTSYKGKYDKEPWFQTRMFPLETAFGRTRYRKLVKRLLFESLHKLVKTEQQIDLVEGIFQFQFTVVPESETDILAARKAIEKGVRIVLTDKSFRKSLMNETKLANRSVLIPKLKKQIQLYNSVGETKRLGYFPKLPFLNDTKYLL